MSRVDPAPQRRTRCAVYTRKSTEEGLEQPFNSIDAQKESGHAYITSRRSEGWIPMADDYDDPAYSGGSMERPALQRLFSDIECGKVDVVVVYKLDRLSRSLADFCKMIEIFDRHNVSFVSVTQSFNTGDSMGRLMLNVLLSFAQFEREVTSERIRDKFIASKKRGYWMHGVPPLGYDVVERRLVVNLAEAATVRRIFQRFVDTVSATKVTRELRAEGITTKAWTSKAGRKCGGQALQKCTLTAMLKNRAYLGELKSRGGWIQGTHEPIIDPSLWDSAQAVFTVNPQRRANLSRSRAVYPLKGILVDQEGHAMVGWHTTKPNGKRYCYYLSQVELKVGSGIAPLPRLPAAEIEGLVLDQLREVLRAPEMLERVCAQAGVLEPGLDEAQVVVAMTQIDRIWASLFPAEQARLMRLMVERVIVGPASVEIRMRPGGFAHLLREFYSPRQEERI
jgi:site-specific DNA recombinase